MLERIVWQTDPLRLLLRLQKNEPRGNLVNLSLTKLKQTGKKNEKLKLYIIFLGINLYYYYTALKCTPNTTNHCKEETNI